MGSTPIGGPAIGWVIAAAGARVGLGVGGLSCLVATGIGVVAISRLKARKLSQPVTTVDIDIDIDIGTGPSVAP
jgi:hypothetical protein